MGLESLSGRMTLLAKSELYLGRFESVEEKVAAIESVTEHDILALAQTYLREQDWHTVCIPPEE
jgi:predicted Zn-dependent peptidase